VRIENELVSRVALAWFSLRGIVVRDHLPGLGAAVAARVKRLRELYSEPTAATPILASARALYRRFGIDPSKRRPFSEALLRV
jgi:DNA/RNA-binding domain of Phe-tRNA-synthetase-like protein